MNAPNIARPLPEPTAESRPYWEGLKGHRLVLQRCAACKTPRHYPRPMCAACFSLEDEWFEASGTGTVHSWTVSHHAFHRGFKIDIPYVLLTVDLADGVRMVAPLVELVDNDASRLTLDLPVVLDYQDVSDKITLPRFRIDG
ncbi:MAG: hypothetical protein CL477_14770 [Acidobacteria bacterium]|jgi:hypothetical protein|nr:hypothetical protein [Acidobacteriota bacterium]MDP7338412.1 OB-fold domain-containing protein [Vicinamibacterales bacterium]HJN45776.1 OB-fold domain-containing protein [Vicinamibacterales bacterium]